MRRFLFLSLLAAACATAPPPPPPAAPAAAATPAVHGLTLEEEARILQIEDRREFDAALAEQWVAHANALHRARMALALARIGPHTFVDGNGNGERDGGEQQAGVDLLARLTNDPDRAVRETAAFALGEIGDAAGIAPLLTFARDSDAGVAAEAVEALAKLAAEVPLAQYREFTAEPLAEGVRARAIRFLFRFNTDEASAIAAALLDTPFPVIRQEAAYALARRAYAPARERLELLLGDPNVLTRAYAASALGRIAARESVAPLLTAQGDIHPWVRTNAVAALSRIAAKDATAIARPQLAEDVLRLIATSDDADPGTRAASIDALGYYATRSEVARTRLNEIAANGSRWERELAAAAIAKQWAETNAKAVDEVLAKATNWGRVRVLEATAQLPKSGVTLRRRLAADPDVMVRAMAISSIPDATVDAEMSLIRPALTHEDVIIRTNAIERYAKSISELAEKKVETLRAAEQRGRSDALNDARTAAISALAEIEHAERETFLRSLLADRDPVVRRIAAEAVEQKLNKPRPQYTPLAVDRPLAEYQEIVEWSRGQHTATIHMTRGKIELALLTRDAPMTAWNFAQLAKRKFYDDTTFMRVVPNFVIQGGDPRNDQNGGPGYAIRDEINLQKYTRGAVGMALSGPDTGGSQFFVTHSPQPHLDGGYTIFGRVYEGMGGVVDQTERGDRVETITIDERPPVQASAFAGAQRTPLPTQIGVVSAERLLSAVPEYEQRKAEYQPDVSLLEFMASSIQPNDRVEIFLGTWCSDSQREVPRFLKIVDTLKERFGKDLPLTFVAVDRSKSKPADLIAAKSIEKVSTFIYYRGSQELGRIVEKPRGLLEDDLLAIVATPR